MCHAARDGHSHTFSRCCCLSAGHRVCVASAAAVPAPDMTSVRSKYAILRLGGVRQMLQEGLLYSCPKHCLLQEQQQHAEHFSTSTSAGNGSGPAHQPQLQETHASTAASAQQRSFVLSRVLCLHNGQEFTWGSPYVPNTSVEVEVVEEFQGPKPHSSSAAASASDADSSTMTIYRVKQIRAAE